MKEYLKMSDVFPDGVYVCTEEWMNGWFEVRHVGGSSIDESCDGGYSERDATYVAHAINSHDELVDSYQLAAKERDEWEARVCKEASRVKDLEEFLYHFLAHSHNVDVGGGDFTATTCEALDMAEKLDNRTYPDLWPGH